MSGQNGFWCGFCERVLESECTGGAGGVGLLDERFNHIDVEHFKKGERGVNWKFPGQGIHFTGEGEGDGERRKRRCLGL